MRLIGLALLLALGTGALLAAAQEANSQPSKKTPGWSGSFLRRLFSGSLSWGISSAVAAKPTAGNSWAGNRNDGLR
jgi:hypothetical protein